MKNTDVPHLEVGVKNLALGERRGGGEEPLKSRWAMCSKCLETITLFRSTICDFFLPCFRPDPKSNAPYQNCPKKDRNYLGTASIYVKRLRRASNSLY